MNARSALMVVAGVCEIAGAWLLLRGNALSAVPGILGIVLFAAAMAGTNPRAHATRPTRIALGWAIVGVIALTLGLLEGYTLARGFDWDTLLLGGGLTAAGGVLIGISFWRRGPDWIQEQRLSFLSLVLCEAAALGGFVLLVFTVCPSAPFP